MVASLKRFQAWWRDLMRYSSMQAARNWTLFMTAWALLPIDYQMALVGWILPPEKVQGIIAMIALARILQERARFQPELHEPIILQSMPSAPAPAPAVASAPVQADDAFNPPKGQ